MLQASCSFLCEELSPWLTPDPCAAAESYMMRAEVEDGFEDVAYSETALVYQALEDFPVMGQAGLVVGSIMPWAEAILFLAGARARCRRCACPQQSAGRGWTPSPPSCPHSALGQTLRDGMRVYCV